jgi:hypothetical protein
MRCCCGGSLLSQSLSLSKSVGEQVVKNSTNKEEFWQKKEKNQRRRPQAMKRRKSKQ